MNLIEILNKPYGIKLSDYEKRDIVRNLFQYNDKLNRELIIHLQHLVSEHKTDNLYPATEILNDGVYVREITVPKHTLVIGATHKEDHLFMVIKGKAKVISNHTNFIISAGYIEKAKANTKRLAITLEDTVFVNVHSNKNNITDLEELRTKLVNEDWEYKNGMGNFNNCNTSTNWLDSSQYNLHDATSK